MILSERIDQLQNSLAQLKSDQASSIVGFVPTMGALHVGHLQLVKEAQKVSDIVVVSIFVNPSQFNDKSDLEKYPRTLEADKKLLEDLNVDVLFFPSESMMYPDGIPQYSIDFEGIDQVMEGKFRDNHFEGVAMIVERLFNAVQPDKAFFGLKDFQQVAIINQMVKVRGLKVDIIPVDIVRSDTGLALSSRNQRLSENQKEEALIIYRTLLQGKSWAKELSIQELQDKMKSYFNEGSLKLEYLEIVDPKSLQTPKDSEGPWHCCIAAYCGEIRLIDNMRLK